MVLGVDTRKLAFAFAWDRHPSQEELKSPAAPRNGKPRFRNGRHPFLKLDSGIKNQRSLSYFDLSIGLNTIPATEILQMWKRNLHGKKRHEFDLLLCQTPDNGTTNNRRIR